MSNCSRCSVESIIQKRGLENVIEIIDDNQYHILIKENNKWAWSMTVTSESHSKDEDCFLLIEKRQHIEKDKNGRRLGFPKYRLPTSFLAFKIIYPYLSENDITDLLK